jgi:hypothetical protein
MDRKTWDRLISGTGLVLALLLLVVGAMAIFGGSFGKTNVTDRLEPQNISFPPAEAMTPEETAEVGDFAGQAVTDGVQAEAYSRYIGLHVAAIGGGQTYAELGGPQRELQAKVEAARESGDPQLEKMEGELAALTGQRDTVFKGETLRAILLNAYGWWTVATIAMFAGYFMIGAGILLAIFAALGFRHAKKVELATVKEMNRVAA